MVNHINRPWARPGVPVATLLTVALAALAGCGGSSSSSSPSSPSSSSSDNGVASKSAGDILAASKAAAASATSVHVSGKNGTGPVTVTLDLDLSSGSGRANLSLAGNPFELIRIGETLYLKGGNPALYQRLGVTAQVPQSTWLKVPAKQGSVSTIGSFTQLSAEVNSLIGDTASVSKGATTTVNGQKAVELKQTAVLYTGHLYIAVTGKPYPIEIVKTGQVSGKTTFSNWNKPVALTPPPGAVDISQFKRAGH